MTGDAHFTSNAARDIDFKYFKKGIAVKSKINHAYNCLFEMNSNFENEAFS